MQPYLNIALLFFLLPLCVLHCKRLEMSEKTTILHLNQRTFQKHSIFARSAKDYVITHKARVTLQVGDEPLGHFVVGMFGDEAPKTVENFVELCQDSTDGYPGSIFHRVIKGFMMQGGDITHGDGTGGRSIYGPLFDDENLKMKMMGPGTLAMANSGENTNNSQFFVTFVNTKWLNHKHQVFGKVLSGMNVVKKVEKEETNDEDRPLEDIKITDCEAKEVEPYTLEEYMSAPRRKSKIQTDY